MSGMGKPMETMNLEEVTTSGNTLPKTNIAPKNDGFQ